MREVHAAARLAQRSRHEAVVRQQRRVRLKRRHRVWRGRRERVSANPAHAAHVVDGHRGRQGPMTRREARNAADHHPAPGHGRDELARVHGHEHVGRHPIDRPRRARVTAREVHVEREPHATRVDAHDDETRAPRRGGSRQPGLGPVHAAGKPAPAQRAGDRGISGRPSLGRAIEPPPFLPRAALADREGGRGGRRRRVRVETGADRGDRDQRQESTACPRHDASEVRPTTLPGARPAPPVRPS